MKVLVLGTGIVGHGIAEVLSKKYEVTVADKNERNLINVSNELKVDHLKVDVENDDLEKIFEGFDLISGALPGKYGLKVLKSAAKAGVNIVDNSFMPEDFYILDKEFNKAGVLGIPDCGVAPGLSNIIVGYAASRYEYLEGAYIKVGGLPERNIPPLGYKVVFSPIDTLDEYTRKVQIVKDWVVEEVDPGEGLEYFFVNSIGSMEAFYTNGLRSLIRNIRARNLNEKTIRYRGHMEKIKFLRQIGLLDEEPIEVDGTNVIPKEVLAVLMKKYLSFPEINDLLYMEIKIESNTGVEETYTLFDKGDYHLSAMARTTGFTNAVVSDIVLKGKIKETGIIAPEILSKDLGLYDDIYESLKSLGIEIKKKVD